MKFTLASVAAFAAAALAKPSLTNSQYDITEGDPFTFTWSDAEGPVTITLMTGPSDNLKPVKTITSGETGSSYTWTPEDVPSGTYAIRISDSSAEPNYSPPFTYVGTGALPSTSASVSSVTRATTSAESTETTESSSSETETSTGTDTNTTAAPTTTGSSSTSEAPTTTRTRPTSTPPNSNDSQRFASPLALVLVTVAALVFFN